MNKQFFVIILMLQPTLFAEFNDDEFKKADERLEFTHKRLNLICSTGAQCDENLLAYINQSPEEFRNDVGAKVRAKQIVESLKQTEEFALAKASPENEEAQNKLNAKIREMIRAHEMNLEQCILGFLYSDEATTEVIKPNFHYIQVVS